MIVTFRRTGERRYGIEVKRPGFPDLIMHPAPGYDPWVPHDLMHFVVEAVLGMPLGVFGQLAAGGDAGSFHSVPDALSDVRKARRGRRREGRRAARLSREGHGEASFSERAAVLCEYGWHSRSSDPERLRRAHDIAPYVKRLREESSPRERVALSREALDAVCERLDAVSAKWRALEVGQALTLKWPFRGAGERR